MKSPADEPVEDVVEDASLQISRKPHDEKDGRIVENIRHKRRRQKIKDHEEAPHGVSHGKYERNAEAAPNGVFGPGHQGKRYENMANARAQITAEPIGEDFFVSDGEGGAGNTLCVFPGRLTKYGAKKTGVNIFL